MANSNTISSEWEIGLCEIGNCGACMYGCFCPQCAIAQSRSNLDGSSCLFNLFFLHPCVTTRLVKSAYGIEQSTTEDCLKFCCLPHCYANQIYQTTWRRGNPSKEDSGIPFNTQPLINKCPTLNYWCYALWCPCLLHGDMMEKVFKMPYWMGCCCVPSTAALNTMRYQYRLRGDDDSECAMGCCPVLCSICIAAKVAIVAEEIDRHNVTYPRYLVRPAVHNTISGQIVYATDNYAYNPAYTSQQPQYGGQQQQFVGGQYGSYNEPLVVATVATAPQMDADIPVGVYVNDVNYSK